MDLPLRFNAFVDFHDPNYNLQEAWGREIKKAEEIFGHERRISVEPDGIIRQGYRAGLPVIEFRLDLFYRDNFRWLTDFKNSIVSSVKGIHLQSADGVDQFLVEKSPHGHFRFAELHDASVQQ